MKYNIVVIGGGPAGLAAAVAAHEEGISDILIIERDCELGGILNQCIHNGFGLHTFHEELTGPEYAARFISMVENKNIDYKLNTTVLHIRSDKQIIAMNSIDGIFTIETNAIILAMGCRERARGSLNIPGYRPAGILSAGTAQRLVNIEGFLPGYETLILGSGDIGLIMARRMTLEGANVKAVAELLPFSGGLKRNIVQCLDDYQIPLLLNHTVIDIHGKERIEGITLAKVDSQLKPIPGTEINYTCDTLLLSVGLIPENELSREIGIQLSSITNGPTVDDSMETNFPGVFACGNALHVHDLVDYVSDEAAVAGRNAAHLVLMRNFRNIDKKIPLICNSTVRYTVPAFISFPMNTDTVIIRFRVNDVFKNHCISVRVDGREIIRLKRLIMTPGEMEKVTLERKNLQMYPELQQITIGIEEG